MSSERIVATYLIETPHPVEHAAEVVAGEQSSGTFVELPGETDTLQQRHGARIERIEELETVNAPSLPGARYAPAPAEKVRYRRAEVEISIPLENVGSSLPALDRKSTRLNSSHANISYAVFCLKKKIDNISAFA